MELMSDDFGQITCQIERDELGQEKAHYTWSGPPVARLSKWMVKQGPGDGEFIEMGPWLLRVIDEQPWCDVAIVELVDHPWAWAYALRHKLRRAWQELSFRLVYTLIIWGLAKRPDPGAMIDWYLVKEKWL